jgi:DNA mismatch repair protein MSH5
MAKYRSDPDEYAGMGKIRLSLVKLGCWVNVDVPMAVSPRLVSVTLDVQVSATGGLLTYLAKQTAADTDCYENVEVPVDSIESMQL